MKPKAVFMDCIFYVEGVMNNPADIFERPILNLLAVPKDKRAKLEEFRAETIPKRNALRFVSELCSLHGIECRHEDRMIVNALAARRNELREQLEAVCDSYAEFFRDSRMVCYSAEPGRYAAGQILTKLPRGTVYAGRK